MKDMNIAKLTSDDLPLFLDIVTDLFPTADVPSVDYEEIISYITNEAIKLKLQVIYFVAEKYNVNPRIPAAPGGGRCERWHFYRSAPRTRRAFIGKLLVPIRHL